MELMIRAQSKREDRGVRPYGGMAGDAVSADRNEGRAQPLGCTLP